MRKYKIFLITITTVFFLLVNNASAWSNGNSGNAYADDVVSYDYNDNFGTHDWVAYNSLSQLISNGYDLQWLSERQDIYLLGTEAPDNSGVSVTLDGTVVAGFGDTTWHHIYYNEDGSIQNNEDDAGLRAKAMGDLADSYIEVNKLDLASFYLGAMTHYITDLSMFAHTSLNNVAPHYRDFDLYHSTIEGYVQTRTNEYNDIEEFFIVSDITVEAEAPYNVAVALGWDTYKDPNPSETTTRDIVWLHDNHFTGWVQDYSDRSSETALKQLYYDRIEESLNNAIEGCASAILYETSPSQSTLPSYPLYLLIGISIVSIIIIVKKNNIKRK